MQAAGSCDPERSISRPLPSHTLSFWGLLIPAHSLHRRLGIQLVLQFPSFTVFIHATQKLLGYFACSYLSLSSFPAVCLSGRGSWKISGWKTLKFCIQTCSSPRQIQENFRSFAQVWTRLIGLFQSPFAGILLCLLSPWIIHVSTVKSASYLLSAWLYFVSFEACRFKMLINASSWRNTRAMWDAEIEQKQRCFLATC